LDVAIAQVVNESPLVIHVHKGCKSDGFDTSMKPSALPGRYWFGEMDPSRKAALCRLRGSQVVVRVGGGWQDLSTFLLDHSNLESPAGILRSFSTHISDPDAGVSSTTEQSDDMKPTEHHIDSIEDETF
jgi:hypothetical protein